MKIYTNRYCALDETKKMKNEFKSTIELPIADELYCINKPNIAYRYKVAI